MASVAIITEAYIGVKGRACVDACPHFRLEDIEQAYDVFERATDTGALNIVLTPETQRRVSPTSGSGSSRHTTGERSRPDHTSQQSHDIHRHREITSSMTTATEPHPIR